MLDVLIKTFMIIAVCGIAAQREFEERIKNLDKRKQ